MLKFTTAQLSETAMEILALAVCEDKSINTDAFISQCVAKVETLAEFKGEKDQQVTLYDLNDTRIRRCIFIGLGPEKDLNTESLRIFAARAVKAGQKAKCKRLVLAMPDADSLGLDTPTVIRALLEGACLANHSFERYKQKPKDRVIEQIALWTPPATAGKYRTLPAEVQIICQGTLCARDWINLPANDKPPEKLAALFATAAEKAGLQVNILDRTRLQRQKFGALLAVAAGSDQPPCLVEMTHSPAKTGKTIVLVGKGVTFDTGGINLKPSANLDTMKADMSGAACVAATMVALAGLKIKHRVVGLMPLVENMPSGRATRPGDIVTSYAGKTIEIGNTDAEGRLILVDAMAYAIKKYRPDILIDLATLTGACVIALGEKIAGVFSRDDDLAQAILDAAAATDERCWRLPLPRDYQELLKSDLADISNMSSSRYGGAITAALFLAEFVDDTRWAHIDIAGPAFSKKAEGYCGPGGAGFGVRLLCRLMAKMP